MIIRYMWVKKIEPDSRDSDVSVKDVPWRSKG